MEQYSHIIFSIYMDGLFEQLKKSGVGCHMGNDYTGCIGHADDLTLLTPTRSGLKVLIDICQQYAHEYCVNFNGTKSRYLIFRGRNCKPYNRTVFFNDTKLYCAQDAVHLDHHISVVNKDSLVADATAKFWREYNMFMADFGHIKTNVKCNLFKQYCCSYYGAPLWDLHSKSVGTICTAWRKALRKLWGLAPLTHGDVIALLLDSLPLLIILKQRF